jgi:hypothetical protein
MLYFIPLFDERIVFLYYLLLFSTNSTAQFISFTQDAFSALSRFHKACSSTLSAAIAKLLERAEIKHYSIVCVTQSVFTIFS